MAVVPSAFVAVASADTRLVLVVVVAAAVGLAVGSFLNVVVYRVPRRLSVAGPRSFCPHCRHPIAAVDNVPVVSWLILRGRCRHCRKPISARYPLVELLTAAVFALVAGAVGARWSAVGFCVLAATSLASAAIAADGLIPPASLSYVGTALGVAALVAAAAAGAGWGHLEGAAAGVAAAGLLVLVLSASLRASDTGSVAAAGLTPLLPVGAWVGWLGLAATSAGAGAAVVTALALVSRWRRPSTRGAAPSVAAAPAGSQPAASRRHGDGRVGERGGPGGWAAVAAAVAMTAALATSAALGNVA